MLIKAALYDLRLRGCPTTYDYFVWLVQVKMMGYDSVCFATEQPRGKKHPGKATEALARFENFIWPSPPLIGMKRFRSSSGERIGSCLIPDTIRMMNDIGRTDIPRLKSGNPLAVTYTVTLRSMAYKPERNSDEDVWRRFAQKIGAFVIEDHFVKPISLEDRLSILAGAKMNFGVMGGPMALLLWTPYPMSAWCDPGIDVLMRSMRGHDMDVGGQWPFQLPHQRLVWKQPALDNLMREFECGQSSTI